MNYSRSSFFVSVAMVVASFGVTTASAQPCETAKLVAFDGSAGDWSGRDIAMSGDVALVGAAHDDDRGEDSGSAYILEMVDGEWMQTAKLRADDGAADDWFGWSVAVSGETALVGARYDDDNGDDSGAAYVFEKIDGDWRQVAKLVAAEGTPDDLFGHAVAVSGDIAVVGATRDDDGGINTGSAYVFERDNGVWTQVAKLHAPDGAIGDWFGFSVALSGETTIIGSRYDDDRGEDSGSAYVFNKVNGLWVLAAKLTAADGAAEDWFGVSVAIDGDAAIVGTPSADDHGSNSGAAYMFEKVDGAWVQVSKLLAADGVAEDIFGWSVAVSDDLAMVGARFDDDRGDNSGSAYLFEKVDDGWEQAGKMRASDGAATDSFGFAVALSGDTALVGAFADDDRGSDSGSVYAFDLGCPPADCLDLQIDNLIAGETATFIVTHGTPGAKSATVYGTKAGRVSVDNYAGYCATFGIAGVTQDKVIGGLKRRFDTNGESIFRLSIPGNLAGRRLFFQSAEHGTCPDECMSNVVEIVVQ